MEKLSSIFSAITKIFKVKNIFIKKTVGIILILLGIIVIASAIYMIIYADNRQKNMMATFEKSLERDVDTNVAQNSGLGIIGSSDPKISTAATPNDKSPNDKSLNDKSPDEKAPDETGGAIGIIRIPKINVKVAIGEGIDMDTLKYAVGHFPDTAMAGEKGNFCVAGHRSYTYSEYFNRLDELDKGDEIYVTTKKGEFKYIVFEKKVVEPSEYSVLDKTSDATMTLVTCTPIRVATHRLIIKARLQ